MPSKRKSHVKRVYKILTNPDDKKEKVPTNDFYMDVLRLDSFVVAFRVSTDDGNVGQEIQYVIKWNDDKTKPLDNVDSKNADEQFENANAKRKTEKRIIKDPAIKAADETEPFYLWIVKSLKVRLHMEAIGIMNQVQQIAFNSNSINDSYPVDPNNKDQLLPPAKGRKTTIIKVVSRDLKELKMHREDGTAIIVDWADYREALRIGDEDKDDVSLTFEFTDKFIVLFQSDRATGSVGQGIAHVLQNTEIEGLFTLGDPDVKDADNKSALIRIDPFQYIVNVGTNITAVEYLPEDE